MNETTILHLVGVALAAHLAHRLHLMCPTLHIGL